MKSLLRLLRRVLHAIFSFTPPPVEEPPAPPPLPPEPPVVEPPLPPLPPIRDRCLDMANFWLPGPVTDLVASQYMQKAKDQGFVGIIAGTQIPSVTNQQVKAALSVGLWADVYHYVHWNISMTYQADAILYAIEDVKDRVNVVWIDLEETPEGLTTYDVLQRIKTMVEYLQSKGCTVGIYTRKAWWVSYTLNSIAFAGLLLWATEYDEYPPYDDAWWNEMWFGGWATGPTWVQFAPDVNVAGMNVDISERYVP